MRDIHDTSTVDLTPLTELLNKYTVPEIYRAQEVATATSELEKFLAELDKVKERDVEIIRIVAWHNLAMAKKMLTEEEK